MDVSLGGEIHENPANFLTSMNVNLRFLAIFFHFVPFENLGTLLRQFVPCDVRAGPVSIGTMVMQSSTGQTVEQRSQPTQSSSRTTG